MVETHDPANWYPDPTGAHELRYWDGYAWLDDVSDHGTRGHDPLGGKPLPPPSQVAARQPQQASAPAKGSKTPIIVAGVIAAVVVIAAAVFFLTRDSGSNVATLNNKAVTFQDDPKDATHPTVHTLKVAGNQVVTVLAKGDDDSLTPAVIVLSDQKTADSVTSQISDASDVLGSSKIKDVCSNLREEDIGAKGTVLYFSEAANDSGEELRAVVPVPIAAQFEFVAVLVNSKDDCEAGKVSTTLQAVPLDQSDVSNLSDLGSSLSDDSDLSDFLTTASS